MFYQTQISKLCTGGAIDTKGKQLKFCGNLPVREGDWVWTDGAVIFGHVPIRDSVRIPHNEGGIPAAFADDKGYFSKTGNFSKYSIAVDKTEPHWIVNGKHKYFHSDTRVFDAEISINERGVEDGLFTAELDGINGGNAGIYFVRDDTVLDDDAVVIQKDGKEIRRVYLHDYIHAIDKAQEIVNRVTVDPTEKKFVGHSQLLNFQLHTDGSWDAIIASFAYAELRWEYKSYPPNDGQSHHVDEDFRRAWKVVESDPKRVYYGDAYNEVNSLVLFNTNDTLDDMVQKTRNRFADLGFDDIQEDLYDLVGRNGRGVGIVNTIWDFGDRFVDIKPPDGTAGTEKSIFTYYLVHANSKGVTYILHEYANANALKIFDDERYIFDEIPIPENVNKIDFFWSAWNKDTDLPITHILGQALGLTDPFGMSVEIFDPRVTYWHVYVKRPVLYEDDAISIQHYQPTWLYPLQDEYWCEMDEWKILAIFDKDYKPIVHTLKDSDEPFTLSFNNERKLHTQKERLYFFKDSVTPYRSATAYNVVLGIFVRSSFYDRSYCLPRGENCTYLSGYGYVTGATGWLFLPAVVKLKNGGYLIGIRQDKIYKVDTDGVAELISDKEELANLRLRYMPNLSKTRR